MRLLNPSKEATLEYPRITPRVIDRGELVTRLIDLCLKSGLTGMPRKIRDQHIMFKSVVLTLNKGVDYGERDIDDKLAFWLADIGRSIDTDRVSLRRWLVDTKYLERTKDGSSYKVCFAGPGQRLFALDVENIDVYEAIGVAMKSIEQRKREYTRRRLGDGEPGERAGSPRIGCGGVALARWQVERSVMYLIRRAWKIKPGNMRKAAEVISQIGKRYEEAGQRSTTRVYWSGYTVPGQANTVYMDWTEEAIRSPYREGNKSPDSGDLGAQLREIQEESYIEFYEMYAPD